MRFKNTPDSVRSSVWAILVVVAFALPRPAAAQEDTAQAGYLKLVSSRDSILVVVDGRFEAFSRMAAGDSLELPEGPHRIVVAARNDPDYVFDVDIIADQTLEHAVWYQSRQFDRAAYLEHSSYPPLTEELNLKIFTDADTDIFIDGEWAGRGAAFRMLPGGEYRVMAVHKSAGTRRNTVTIAETPPRLQEVELFTKPVQHIARALSLAPGASQWYKGERRKSIGAAALISIAAAVAISHQRSLATHQATFTELQAAYESATDEITALRLGDEADAMHRHIRSDASARDLWIGLSLGLYAANIADGLRKPKGGFREGRPIHVRLGSASGTNRPELRIQYTF